MKSAFIPDGYTVDATINGSPDFEPFEITYRPMLRGERNRLLWGVIRARESGRDEDLRYWERQTVESLAKHVQKWNLTGPDGKAIRITADNLERIHSAAFEQIYNVVAGYSDPKDGGDSEEDADRKNSPAG